MKKLLCLFITLCFMFSIVSCSKKKDNDDDKNNNENQSTELSKEDQEKYNEIINKPMNNVTINYDIKSTVVMGETSQTVQMPMVMKLDGDNAYMSLVSNGMHIESYVEKAGEAYKMWGANDGEWMYAGETTEEQGVQIPTIEIEQGDFNLENGLLVGNVEALNKKINTILSSVPNMEDVDLSNVKLTKYIIVIKDNVLSEIKMDMGMKMQVEGQTMECLFSYSISFTNVGTTKLERPAGLPLE